MNRADPASEAAAAVVSASTFETRLSGRRLVLARVGFSVIALFYLAMFAVSFPGLVMQLQSTCTSACADWQLAPEAVRMLERAGLSLGDYVAFSLVVVVVVTLAAVAVVALLLWRRSDDWMALLVGLMLLSFGPLSFTNTVLLSSWLGPALATHLLSLSEALTFGIITLAFYLFPDGRFVPRWTRWLMVMGLGLSIFFVIFPRRSSAFLDALSGILYISVLLSLAMAQVYRYRWVSTPAQRQQTKWVVYTLAMLILLVEGLFALPQHLVPGLGQPGSLFASLGTVVSDSLLVFLPISFGLAILRYHLYEVDLLINRTLVYGSLSALLALIYFGLILTLQYLLRGMLNQQNDVAIVISTLMVAALSQPLRRRIQTLIDRRFYRRKYDAAKVLEAFSASLRTEVDLTGLQEQLVAVVQETMQPSHVSLWLRQPEQQTHEHLTHKEPV
ncbi:MAG TPA: hypothetical protein VF026_16300 [Ktedonobacteraceae bacterium]